MKQLVQQNWKYTIKQTRLNPYTKNEIERIVAGIMSQRQKIGIDSDFYYFMKSFTVMFESRPVPSYLCDRIANFIASLCEANPNYSVDAVKALAVAFDITEMLQYYIEKV